MTVISGGRVLDRCLKCGKWVQLNKRMLGAMHVCVSDCEYAGRHLGPIEEERRGLFRRKRWAVCRGCGAENRVATQRQS